MITGLSAAASSAVAAFIAVRGPRSAVVEPEVVPEAVAEDTAPDMAELLKMMATIIGRVGRAAGALRGQFGVFDAVLSP